MTSKIAFLGLGAMGSRMAERLIKADHHVTVWNRTAARAQPLINLGAQSARSPADAVADADIVIAMVRDNEASRRVWLDPVDGAVKNIRKDAVAVECSTISIDWTRELGAAMSDRGLAFVDAPVAGSRPQADAGQLIFLVGGDARSVDRLHPVFSAMGGAAHHAGANGSGAAVKLAVNSLFAVQVAACAEILAMVREAGLDPGVAIEIIANTPVASPAFKGAAASMLASSYAPMFPVELVEKDLGYMMQATRDLPMSAAARDVMAKAAERGLGAENLTAVAKLYKANAS